MYIYDPNKILILRSWPTDEPEGHAKTIDAIPRFLNDSFDYAGLASYDRDIIHLDWDMAVSPEQLQLFGQYAHEDREHCLVAPYKLYPGGRWGKRIRNHPEPIWAAFRYVDGKEAKRYVTEDDEVCDLWGFGMVYLPKRWIHEYVDTFPGQHFGDISFSGWYYDKVGPARLTWDVLPIHLNFPIIREV